MVGDGASGRGQRRPRSALSVRAACTSARLASDASRTNIHIKKQTFHVYYNIELREGKKINVGIQDGFQRATETLFPVFSCYY